MNSFRNGPNDVFRNKEFRELSETTQKEVKELLRVSPEKAKDFKEVLDNKEFKNLDKETKDSVIKLMARAIEAEKGEQPTEQDLNEIIAYLEGDDFYKVIEYIRRKLKDTVRKS